MGLFSWLRGKRSKDRTSDKATGSAGCGALHRQPGRHKVRGDEALAVALIFAGMFATSFILEKVRARRATATTADAPVRRELACLARARGQQLSQEERAQLEASCEEVDFKATKKAFGVSCFSATVQHLKEIVPLPADLVHPLEVESPQTGYTGEQGPTRRPLLQRGLPMVAAGKVAVLCLAGGQGTRLGSDAPKGIFDIGLPSHKSLFQIHCDRLWRMQTMAASFCREDRSPIQLVIMTSPATDQPTRKFFQQHNYFRLHRENVHFLVQGQLPCLTPDGNIIMATRSTLAMAPNGNGGMYTALVKSGVLDLLEQRGVQYIDTFCVDNALARMADPHFVGLTDMEKADVGCKVIAKAYPEERVGVFALRDDKLEVVEYSELEPQQAIAVNPAGSQLLFNWANISTFCFATSFIRVAARELESTGRHHIAGKQIPSVDGPVQGIKLESFIFDPLYRAQKVCLMEVERASQFAPVKNANGAADDTPNTAQEATLALHRRGPEISSSLSYFGENLAKICDGRIITSQYDEILQDVLDEAEVNARLRQEEERWHERAESRRRGPNLFGLAGRAINHLTHKIIDLNPFRAAW